VVLAVGASVRVANWLQVQPGSILYFHQWEQSDMSFFHEWGQHIAGGDLLGAPRPYHRWHGEVALEVHRRQRPGVPFDEERGRAQWRLWLGDRAFYQDPLYAYLLGACYRVFGPRVEPVLVLQGLMGLAIAALAFALGDVLGGRWTALLAGLMAALYAPLVFYEGTLLRGVLQALLSLALVAAAQRGLEREQGTRWWLAAGLCGGALAMTHSTGLLLVAGLGGLAVLREHGPRRRRDLLCFAGGLAVALLPFAARNLAVGLSPLASPAYGPVNFIISNAADRNPWVGFPISEWTDEILEETGGRLLPVIRATLATHPGPGSWLRLALQKLLVFVNDRETVDNINFSYYLLQAPLMAGAGLRFALVAPLGLGGILLAGRRRPAVPLLLGLASGLVIAVAFFTSSRLRLTTALMLVPFAALFVVESARRLRAGQARSLLGPGLGVLALAVVVLVEWAPAGPAVRSADYVVGNSIALERARRQAGAGAVEAALRTLDVQLRTEPADLRRLDPQAGKATLSASSMQAAGFFVDLHRLAAALHEARGEREEAFTEARRAEILEQVARRAGAGGL
jgi:4-amino-4-deoxy-L-arabinose transferase-like glycosyltransferase